MFSTLRNFVSFTLLGVALGCKRDGPEGITQQPTAVSNQLTSLKVHSASKAVPPTIEMLPQAHWGSGIPEELFTNIVIPSQMKILKWMVSNPSRSYFIEGLWSISPSPQTPCTPMTIEDLGRLHPNRYSLLQQAFPDPKVININALTDSQQRQIARIGAPYVALYLGIVPHLRPTLTESESRKLSLRHRHIVAERERQQRSPNAAGDIVQQENELLTLNELYSISQITLASTQHLKDTGTNLNPVLIMGALHLDSQFITIRIPESFK